MCDDAPEKKPNQYRSAIKSVADCAEAELVQLGYEDAPGPSTTLSASVDDPDTWDTPTLSGEYAQTVRGEVDSILNGIESARSGAEEDYNLEPETVDVPGPEAWKASWDQMSIY